MGVIALSFKYQPFAFDGGLINNASIAINAHSEPPEITATNASGWSGTVSYQWQQSFDNNWMCPTQMGASEAISTRLMRNTHSGVG